MKRTRPRQAGSARTLDRWEAELRDIAQRVIKLLASIRKAERR